MSMVLDLITTLIPFFRSSEARSWQRHEKAKAQWNKMCTDAKAAPGPAPTRR